MEQYIFTPSSILDLLSQIDELKDYDIGLTETFDNNFRLTVGDSVYDIEPDDVNKISVSNEVVEDIIDTNESTYEDLEDSGLVSYEDQVDITSGIIKEALKTLLIGGMVRLTGKLVGKDANRKK